jgi:hypothetical protein
MSVILQFQMPEHWDSRKRSSYETCTGKNVHYLLKVCPAQSALDIDLGQLAIFLSGIPDVRKYNLEYTYSPLNIIATSSPWPDCCKQSREQHGPSWSNVSSFHRWIEQLAFPSTRTSYHRLKYWKSPLLLVGDLQPLRTWLERACVPFKMAESMVVDIRGTADLRWRWRD